MKSYLDLILLRDMMRNYSFASLNEFLSRNGIKGQSLSLLIDERCSGMEIFVASFC